MRSASGRQDLGTKMRYLSPCPHLDLIHACWAGLRRGRTHGGGYAPGRITPRYTCHKKPGVSFATQHPRSNRCKKCHVRPKGHSKARCLNCRTKTKAGRFKHSGSKKCGMCHSRPTTKTRSFTHPGTSSACTTCPTVATWRFAHPRVSGGEHTYRSFACTRCHPNGYNSYSCTGCHDDNGEDDDD